jgi:hypothetical protein
MTRMYIPTLPLPPDEGPEGRGPPSPSESEEDVSSCRTQPYTFPSTTHQCHAVLLQPLTDTWTSDFLSREGEGREVIGERLRDKTVSWQAQRRLMKTVTNSFPCGTHLHRMGLRGNRSCTLCQRARKQRVDDQHDGCGRIDPETLDHIQSARCTLQTREATSVHHHC